MAETISSAAANSMELALKDNNGLIVDMTPAAALLHATHAHALRSLKEASVCSSRSDEAEQSEQRSPTPTPTNLTTAPSPPMTFRCERCDNFETSSRATLLLHVVQCLAGQAAAAARLKTEEHNEPENMSVVIGQPGSASDANGTNNGAGGGSTSSSASSPANSGGSGNAAAAGSSSAASRKVFECDVCNMKFSNGANMRRHKMRHTGVKPYECRVCQKRFFRKDHLAEHFTTHTKTLPYHCPICNRGFQRQIAMRAHFQNEHVGQHDLVKTCPLCSYRAGSMKSLRIHFFNRHGIDLDNPGPGGTSSLLLALESQASAAAAAAAASYVPGLNLVNNSVVNSEVSGLNLVNSVQQKQQTAPPPPPQSHQSDSGESLRSLENATPPMHFLTPHVEISTLNENGATELFNANNNSNNNGSNSNNNSNNSSSNNNNNSNNNSSNNNHSMNGQNGLVEMNGVEHMSKERSALIMDSPLDCNTKATPITSSTTSLSSHKSSQHHLQHHHHHHHHENHITPSISLIPIKQQEPLNEDVEKSLLKESNGMSTSMDGAGSDTEHSNSNGNGNANSNSNRITSLIKVSPLKSLLREDLKRRICAKANNRITRNATPMDNNNVLASNLSNGGVGVGGGGATATAQNANATPICNGTITSTGQESDLLLNRKQILTCHFCGIEFPDETLYFLHKGCHCESNPWKCNICGEQCNNVYEFNSHLLSKSHQ